MELWDSLVSQPPKLLRAKPVKDLVSEGEFDSTPEEMSPRLTSGLQMNMQKHTNTPYAILHTHTHTIVLVYQLSLQIISI